jgi:hypothetical protein
VTDTIEVNDWPLSIVPARQLMFAAGVSAPGGFTLSGIRTSTPQIGGRAVLKMEFGYKGGDVDPVLVSWLASELGNGSIFSIPIYRSPQLVLASDLGLSASVDDIGLPWDNEGPWDNGQNWAFEPVAEASAAALKGSVTLVVDTTPIGAVLTHGKIIGHKGRAYMIRRASYAGVICTLTLSLPLRVAVADGDLITLRPAMYVTAEDPDSFRTLFEPGGLIQPGSLNFLEAFV